MPSSTVQSEAAAPYHLYTLSDSTVTGKCGEPGQGPYMQIYARIESEMVAEASFQTYSCPNAIACGSWVVRWMEGRGADILARLEAEDLMKVLGGLPVAKEHCAYMTVNTLRDLLRSWRESDETRNAGGVK